MNKREQGTKLLKEAGIGEIELRGLENRYIYVDVLVDGQLYSKAYPLNGTGVQQVVIDIKEFYETKVIK